MARGIGKVTFRGFYGDYKIKVFADGKEIGTTFTLKENEENKIKILGSCGGEGFHAPFCNCEHCETASDEMINRVSKYPCVNFGNL